MNYIKLLKTDDLNENLKNQNKIFPSKVHLNLKSNYKIVYKSKVDDFKIYRVEWCKKSHFRGLLIFKEIL